MNILVLTTSYPVFAGDHSGGFIHALDRALARRGHALRVVVPGRSGHIGRTSLDGIDAWHFRYALRDRGHSLTSTPGGIPEALRRDPFAAARLPVMMGCFVAHAARHAAWADVIWANWLGAGLAGAMVRLARPRPMVLTLRGDDAYLVHDRLLWQTAGRWVFARCAAVTAVSANMAALLEEFLPRRVRPALVPAFGVDTEAFRPAWKVADGPVVKPQAEAAAALFVGNVSGAKGVDVLLRALARCRSRCTLTVVGSGPDLPAMEAMSRELGLAWRVRFLGRKDSRDIPSLMRQADFLVLPSRSEGRPNVVLEAMASGLPVIATPVGDVPELVSAGRTGLLVAREDAEGLAGAIDRLADDADLRSRMARAARACIESESLSWDRTAEQFERIFRRAARND